MKNIRKFIELSAVGLFTAGFLFIIYFKLNCVAYRIPGTAMSPTIFDGEWVWGHRVSQEDLKLHDIVAYERDDMMYISRVVALPGDSIALNQDGRLLINGKLFGSGSSPFDPKQYGMLDVKNYGQNLNLEHIQLDEQHGYNVLYSEEGLLKYREYLSTEPIIVSKDEVYLVSDYRSNAMDSRIYGSVPMQAVKYKMTRVYFSEPNDFSELGKRFKRIGKKLH